MNLVKTTLTFDDGSIQEFNAAPTPAVAPEATEVDIVLTDGTTKKFIPAS